MLSDDDALRGSLRRDAAQVPVPQDLWQKINRRLEEDEARAARRRRRFEAISQQWKSVAAFTAAAGMFWAASLPLGGMSRRVEVKSPGVARLVIHPSFQDIPADAAMAVRYGKGPMTPKRSGGGPGDLFGSRDPVAAH